MADGAQPPAAKRAAMTAVSRSGGSGGPVTYPQWPVLDDEHTPRGGVGDGGGGSQDVAGGISGSQRESAGGWGGGGVVEPAPIPEAMPLVAEAAAGSAAVEERVVANEGEAGDEQVVKAGPVAGESDGVVPSSQAATEEPPAAPYVQESEAAFMRALMVRRRRRRKRRSCCASWSPSFLFGRRRGSYVLDIAFTLCSLVRYYLEDSGSTQSFT